MTSPREKIYELKAELRKHVDGSCDCVKPGACALRRSDYQVSIRRLALELNGDTKRNLE